MPAEEDDPVRRQLMALDYNRGSTGGGFSNRASPNKKVATQLPGLVPINIDKNLEFYLGVRNFQNKRYDGDRLSYDAETTELLPCDGK